MRSIATGSEKMYGNHTPWFGKKYVFALVAAIASSLSAGSALAQDEDNESSVEEVVVIGIRQNLMNAQDIKFDAETVIESITADELGSFPDKSIAEALQRVPGITVNRFAATADTAHFSAEPSQVLVRGLPYVRTEFNGRDSFSANSSRGLSWGDVSPELMSRVDTYKNQMAELTEGGLAGTVDMRTRLPFDQEGLRLAANVAANYGDLSEETTPDASFLYSDRWMTDVGEFGFMGNVAYSSVKTRSEGNELYRMNRFTDVYGSGVRYIPARINFRDNLYDRTRTGTSLALQWKNPDETVKFNTQFNRSDYDNAWEEYVVAVTLADFAFGQSVHYAISNPVNSPQPAPGTSAFVFDQQGILQSANSLTYPMEWWGGDELASMARAQNDRPQYDASDPTSVPNHLVNPCTNDQVGNANCTHPYRGVEVITPVRSNNSENMTQDLSFNLEWDISDRLRSEFDLQYVESTVDVYDIELALGTFAGVGVDLSGDLPVVVLSPSPYNINPSAGGFSNPSNWSPKSTLEHLENSDGEELAFKADLELDLDAGLLSNIKGGIRFADREQTVRSTGYNWNSIATTYTDAQWHYFNINRHDPPPLRDPAVPDTDEPAYLFATAQQGFTGYPDGYYELREFQSDYHKLNQTQFFFADINLLQDEERFASTFGAPALGFDSGVGWEPNCSGIEAREGEEIEYNGHCYTPAEVVDVSEEISSGYVQLNFGGESATMFGMPYSGNLGARFVRTENSSAGGILFPILDPGTTSCYATGDPDGDPAAVPYSAGCYLSPDEYAFANGNDTLSNTSITHDHILPSLNFKLEFAEEWLARLALSRAMSRPDMGNLRNYMILGGVLPSTNNPDDPLWIRNDSGQIIGADIRYSASAQNPYLKPMTADQVDIALEYYFADVGLVALTFFGKDFNDYIQLNREYVDLTNNGVTRRVEVSRPINGEGASLRGAEISFQRFFDFLPSPWDGFGIQANYTKIENDGVTNPSLALDDDGSPVTGQAPDVIEVDTLEGLSEDSYSFILMYEKQAISARLAYSYRSEYLITTIDCCVAYPVWNDGYGQVDGSFSWKFTDQFEVSLQASNLTNAETVTMQQVTNASDGGLLLPAGRFQNDRRYTLRFSYTY